MAENKIITLTFEEVLHCWDNDNGLPTIIARCSRPSEGDVKVKGQADPDSLNEGCDYEFLGQWTTYKNRKTGKDEPQFRFNSFVFKRSLTRRGVIGYLVQAPGIGEARAVKLWEAFKSEAVEIMKTDPERARRECKGMTEAVAKRTQSFLIEHEAKENLNIRLSGLLDGRGFPSSIKEKAKRRWGMIAPDVIERRVYPLMQFRGCNWGLCDKMYLDLGHNPLAKKRQALAAWATVEKAAKRDGHTWVPLGVTVQGVKALIGHGARPDKAIPLAKRARLLTTMRTDSDGEINRDGGVIWTATDKNAVQEEAVAILAAELMDSDPGWNIEELTHGEDGEVSEHQYQALQECLSSPIGILCGGGGTGKSYTAAKLIRHLLRTNQSGSIAVCAPTGKAASRVTEYLAENEVSLTARTIHSTLGVKGTASDEDPGSYDGWKFEHDHANPLPHRFIIVDEFSMVSIDVLMHLLAACQRGTHLLLIGDTGQLAPVGHGAPLRDLIRAGVPYSELTEVRRNEGDVLKNCRLIRDGQRLSPSPRIDLDAGLNFKFVTAASPEQQVEKTIKVIEACTKKGFNPFKDIQVITPTNDKKLIGRNDLNKRLAEAINADQRSPGEDVQFRQGDKVICLKNKLIKCLEGPNDDGWEADWFGDERQAYVANGEQGIVTAIEDGKCVIDFEFPRRSVITKLGKSGKIADFDLAYAITCHKSQGSQWPVSIIILDEHARLMGTKQWLYTACSRAETLCVCIGREVVANRYVKREGLRRKTFLAEILRGELMKVAA